MKVAGSLLMAILVGLVAIWVLFKLLVGTLKLVGVLIAVGLAVGVYLVAQKAIGQGRSDAR